MTLYPPKKNMTFWRAPYEYIYIASHSSHAWWKWVKSFNIASSSRVKIFFVYQSYVIVSKKLYQIGYIIRFLQHVFVKENEKSFNSSFFDAPSPTWLSSITYKSSALNNFLSIICVIIFFYSIFNWMSVIQSNQRYNTDH